MKFEVVQDNARLPLWIITRGSDLRGVNWNLHGQICIFLRLIIHLPGCTLVVGPSLAASSHRMGSSRRTRNQGGRGGRRLDRTLFLVERIVVVVALCRDFLLMKNKINYKLEQNFRL